MKIHLAGLVAGAFLMMAAPGAIAGEMSNLMQSCSQAKDMARCQMKSMRFTEDWPKAQRGIYLSQRDVASCLANGCGGAVAIDLTRACAWRMIIVGAGGKADATDTANVRSDCRTIGDVGRSDALALAQDTFEQIYKRKMSDIVPRP